MTYYLLLERERKGKEHCNSNCLAGCSIAMKALKAQGSPVVLFSTIPSFLDIKTPR